MYYFYVSIVGCNLRTALRSTHGPCSPTVFFALNCPRSGCVLFSQGQIGANEAAPAPMGDRRFSLCCAAGKLRSEYKKGPGRGAWWLRSCNVV